MNKKSSLQRIILFLLLSGSVFSLLTAGGNRQSNTGGSTTPAPSPSAPAITPVIPQPQVPLIPSPALTQPQRQTAVLWDLAFFDYDEQAINDGINDYLLRGFFPTGLYVIPGQSVMVLFSLINQEVSEWAFLNLPLNNLNNDVSFLLSEGWRPLDFDLNPENAYFLFAKTNDQFKGWRIVQVEGSTHDESIQLLANASIEQLRSNRYLYGMSVLGLQISALFVETEVRPVGSRLEIQAFPNDGETPFLGIQALVNRGGLPAALSVTEDFVYVPFYF